MASRVFDLTGEPGHGPQLLPGEPISEEVVSISSHGAVQPALPAGSSSSAQLPATSTSNVEVVTDVSAHRPSPRGLHTAQPHAHDKEKNNDKHRRSNEREQSRGHHVDPGEGMEGVGRRSMEAQTSSLTNARVANAHDRVCKDTSLALTGIVHW